MIALKKKRVSRQGDLGRHFKRHPFKRVIAGNFQKPYVARDLVYAIRAEMHKAASVRLEVVRRARWDGVGISDIPVDPLAVNQVHL
jgi:hypothetical protein